MKVRWLVAVSSLLVMLGEPAGRDAAVAHARARPQTNSCSAVEYRQFDFWVGDWDAFEVNDAKTPVARTKVEAILGDCVLREQYDGTNGLSGQSFTIFDAGRKVWHQSWVTNRGQLLVIEGTFHDRVMELQGEDHANGGSMVRGVWKAVDGGVRETAVRSKDQGKTWEPWFDLVFRPHRP